MQEISVSPLDVTTETTYKIIEHMESEIKKLMEEMYKNIGRFIKELFTFKLHEEGRQQRNLIIAGLVKNHFGKNIGEEIQKEICIEDHIDTTSQSNRASDKLTPNVEGSKTQHRSGGVAGVTVLQKEESMKLRKTKKSQQK